MKMIERMIPFNKKKTIHEKRYDENDAPIIFCTSACFCCFSDTQVKTAPLQNSINAKGM